MPNKPSFQLNAENGQRLLDKMKKEIDEIKRKRTEEALKHAQAIHEAGYPVRRSTDH